MSGFELWKLAIWIVSTIGVVGTLALFALYPAVVSMVFKAVISLFSFVLSYRIGCALVAAAVAAGAVDYARHSYDDERFAAQTAAFEQAQQDRDKRIAEETRESVLKEVADSAAEGAKIDQDVKEFHDALPPIPHVVGAATASPYLVGDDACKLRRIAGLAECEPGGNQGVSKAHAITAAARHLPAIRLPRPHSAIARPDQQGKPGHSKAERM